MLSEEVCAGDVLALEIFLAFLVCQLYCPNIGTVCSYVNSRITIPETTSEHHPHTPPPPDLLF